MYYLFSNLIFYLGIISDFQVERYVVLVMSHDSNRHFVFPHGTSQKIPLLRTLNFMLGQIRYYYTDHR